MSLVLDTDQIRKSAEIIIRNTSSQPPEAFGITDVASLVRTIDTLCRHVISAADWIDRTQARVDSLEAEVARLKADGRRRTIGNMEIQDRPLGTE